jgi:hypothetical protein
MEGTSQRGGTGSKQGTMKLEIFKIVSVQNYILGHKVLATAEHNTQMLCENSKSPSMIYNQ